MSSLGVLIPIQKPDGDLDVFDAPVEKLGWPDLCDLWKRYNVTKPFCFAPPEEKLDVFFYYACKASGRPTSLGTVFNPGWSDHFLKTIENDCLVVSAALAPYLLTKQLFSQHFEGFKLLVIVGDATPDVVANLQDLLPEKSVHLLAHPASQLGAYRC